MDKKYWEEKKGRKQVKVKVFIIIIIIIIIFTYLVSYLF